jgi:hypothetical protein
MTRSPSRRSTCRARSLTCNARRDAPYLTRRQLSPAGGRPIRDSLTESWRQSDRVGSDPARPSAERVSLYFGDGGTYDADGLDDRADMLSELREAVSLMSHDLRRLATEAARP